VALTRGPAPRERSNPARVLIDGRNVQFALARGGGPRGGAPGLPALPTISLIARLRAAFSPPIEVELILDGHAGGGPSGRIAPAFTVTYSRHATADQVIGDRVTEALRALGPAGAWSVIVVTDDREVRDHARRNGARVEGAAWLVERMAAPSTTSNRPGTAIGQGRPPRTPRSG
jgi:YacP-like NYN domain